MITKEQAKKEIERLVEKYNRLTETGDFRKLTEEETKKDFILPLFHALNWDTQNSKEVSAEETISKKRVDYGFRIDGIPKFFLEAKPLKEKLQSEYIEQAINYSWLKSTTWAVLTNFAELKVYNAEWKSRSSVEKMFFELKSSEFIEKFDKLWLLSSGSFLQNELDKTAEEWNKKQKKTPVAPIMKQLFNDLMIWRQKLTKNISENKINMENLKTEEVLDESVQRILDRLIFIRVCEDREIEPRTLMSKLREWKGTDRKGKLFIHMLNDVFREFDKNYNSKLFSKHICEDLVIDDIVLNDIIYGLYDSSDRIFKYDFAAIDANVLGSIYEEYLGYVLRKGKATENGMHRKEMGIYYTPTFVVDYIVKNTLGEMLKEKGDGKIKILDPACGSGSFLIKAFDYLLEYHETHSERNLESFLRKVKILTDNIHGVDLDKQATEITQLNLLLRALEKRRVLPMLQNNIKVGNSLIDDVNVAGNKAFDWNEEFKEVMKDGGFDVIVGNPPYFKIFESDPLNKTIDYQEIKSGMMNVSALFINKSLKLLKNGGYLGMIVPKMLSFTDSWDKIRNKILKNFKVLKVVDCGKAFKGVLLEQIIFILKKESNNLDKNLITIGELDNHIIKETAKIPQELCLKENSIHLEPNPIAYKIKDKMEKSEVTLGKISKIMLGLGIQGKDFFSEESKKGYEKVLRGDDIQRYFIRGSKFYDPKDKNIIKLKDVIEKFKMPHIVAQRIVAHIQDHIKITAALDEEGLFSFNTVTNIFTTDKKYTIEYILALLNSKAVQYYTYKFIYNNAIRSMDFYKAYAQKIPLPPLNKSEQDSITQLVENLISLHKKLFSFGGKNTNETQKLKYDIERIQEEIDQKVYELYGLTKEEIEIIEDSLK
jgi:type I restriction-modification system DNA methylase subunit